MMMTILADTTDNGQGRTFLLTLLILHGFITPHTRKHTFMLAFLSRVYQMSERRDLGYLSLSTRTVIPHEADWNMLSIPEPPIFTFCY